MHFEKSCKKLLECVINNIHSIYLAKYLDSLKDYGTHAELYKIKDFTDYWDFVLTLERVASISVDWRGVSSTRICPFLDKQIDQFLLGHLSSYKSAFPKV